MRVVFFVLYFLKVKIHFILGIRKLKEKWLELGLGLGIFFVLYFSCCIFPYFKYSVDSDLTLTNAKYWGHTGNHNTTESQQKRNWDKNIAKNWREIKFVLTQNVLKIDLTEIKGSKLVDHWENKTEGILNILLWNNIFQGSACFW